MKNHSIPMNKGLTCGKNPVFDNEYVITEWDESQSVVKLICCRGSKVAQKRVNGEPFTCGGGDVVIRYLNGIEHRITLRYFLSLNPMATFRLDHRDCY